MGEIGQEDFFAIEEHGRGVLLAGSPLGNLPTLTDSPLPDPEFAALLRLCEDHRLLGFLAAAIESDRFVATASQRETFRSVYLVWLANALRVERLLLEVEECFKRIRIPMRVLKGVALSHLAYSNPSTRVFADLDLLIPPDRFDEAVDVACSQLGGVRVEAELRPGFDREFGKEVLVKVGNIELDLHRTFASGPFGLSIPLEDIFSSSTPLLVGGRHFNALGRNEMLMHAFYNAALGDLPTRLCSLSDILQLVERNGLELSAVRLMAEQWHATAVVQRASRLVVEAFELPRTHGLHELAAMAVPRGERWLMRSYVTPRRSYSRPLAALITIQGIRPRLRYARALSWPSSAYLQSRGRNHRDHFRLATNRLLGSRNG